jgi:peptide/nickel transport system substrate-binding protein
MATGYASIVSREWVIDHGGWDGDCATWHRYYGRALNQINENELGTGAMGTGPYLLDHWELGKEIVLRANEKYWRREPAWEGGPAGPPAIKEVHFQLISDFDTRFAQLQAREVDSISTDSVPDRSRLDSLVGVVCSLSDRDCQPSEKPEGALEMVRGGPSTTRTDLFFTFEINTAGGNGYIGSGQLDGDGIPPNFFSNEHVRRAFSQCFNYDRYLREVMHGEGIRTINVMLPNMPGYDPDSPYYNYDPERCADEFRQAQFNGRSVWDAGFRMVVPYPSSYPEYKPISEILKDELAALNNKFRIEVLEVEGSEYFGQRRDHKLPLFTGGWLEDVHDPHNWLIPYTVGTFSIYQAVSPDLRNQLESFVTRGVAAADPNERKEIYRGFNRLYYEQAPAILLYVSVNRHYQQRWVNGWFDNPVYPGIYYYVLSKD